MRHEFLISEINDMVGALRAYASVAVSLKKNIGSAVEALMQEAINQIEGFNLVNENLQTNNSEAIDLADHSRAIAIQVTTNASSAKCKKTFSMLEKRNMLGTSVGQYREVRVIGFCKSSKNQSFSSPHAILKVESFTSYLERLSSLSVPKLESIVAHLRASFDFARLHPLHDQHCWEVIFNHLNRDALRHAARFEGSLLRQSEALSEIKTLIFGGVVRGAKAKQISNYFDQDYKVILFDLDLALGRMLAQMNQVTRSGGSYISSNGERQFDAVRLGIVRRINDFNTAKGHVHLPAIDPMV